MIVISAFSWVPPFARGNVRDLPVRWALEEAGLAYRTHLLSAGESRGADYVAWHPFDQVPAFRDGAIELFESGAILLHLGERDERLLPREPAARGRVISWLFASLNAVEPPVRQVALLPLFHGTSEWCAGAVASMTPLAERRLAQVAAALDGQEWIAGEFSIADIMLVYLLHAIGGELARREAVLADYIDRGRARPAYGRALAAQLADFIPDPK